LAGTVVYVDGFGNCLTNITGTDFHPNGIRARGHAAATSGGKAMVMTVGKSYGSVKPGENVAFINVMGGLELAVHAGNFAGTHGIRAGEGVVIEGRGAYT
jgi:S-adenosylmethionine hydrolase